jgi:hypothetical protein
MTEKNREDLNNAIGSELSSWHEYNVQMAADILVGFSDEDWIWLNSEVIEKPPYWQERCAEAIGLQENDCGDIVLISLIGVPENQVAAVAASQLDDKEVVLPGKLRARLEALMTYLVAQRSPRASDVGRLLALLVD